MHQHKGVPIPGTPFFFDHSFFTKRFAKPFAERFRDAPSH